MKKQYFNTIQFLYIALPAILLLSACKKYLSPESISSFDTGIVFNNIPNARNAIIGVYQNLAGDQTYGIRISLYFPYDNDEMMGAGGAGDNDRRDIAHYNVTSGNLQLASPFNQLYNGIERANLCIYYIPKMEQYPGDPTTKTQPQAQLQRMHGEALTLRAHFYFELVRNWGDVPAQWLPAEIQQKQPGGLFQGKIDRDSIYDHILDDLLLAEDMVPWRTEIGLIGDGQDERITKGAVKALRAKIALFRGGYSLRKSTAAMGRTSDYLKYYTIARDECADLMLRRDQHTLVPTYKAIFKDYICGRSSVDPYGEILFQVAMAGGTSNSDSKLGVYNGTKFGGTGGGSLTILPTYFYLFDSTDVRRDVTAAPYETNSNRTQKGHAINQVYDGKFRRDWLSNPVNPTSTAQYLGLNWPLLRFADVLLMYAEADNELNGAPSATAIAAITEVSTRGHGGNAALVTPFPTDHDGFFKALVRERALELGGEGVRKYDLIRWNLLGTALSETIANLKLMAAKSAMIAPSYMAPPPAYALSANLPTSMYSDNNSTADDYRIWVNSLYYPAPTAQPDKTTKVSWIGASAITTTFVNFFATGFIANHNELLPIPQASIDANYNLTQDYGY
jgi:hypothetical protein